jgi:hypothetical protein
MVQLVEVLRYKPEGLWFDSRRDPWDFSVDIIVPATPVLNSVFNRNEFQGYLLG